MNTLRQISGQRADALDSVTFQLLAQRGTLSIFYEPRSNFEFPFVPRALLYLNFLIQVHTTPPPLTPPPTPDTPSMQKRK